MGLTPYKNVIESLFRIPNKAGDIVDFKLNIIQEQLDNTLTGRDDIVKARQEGVTVYIMARQLIDCMRGYARCVMIAHDKDHTERLFARAKLFIELMKGPKPILGRANENEIVFQKTRASLYIGTAGSKTFGRSDTITHLHGSETAFWKDPKTLLAGLYQAVPHDTGIITKESTANGYGTYHHKQYQRAKAGISRFKAHFFPWNIFPEYKSSSPLTSALTEEEWEIKKKFNLTDAQLQWRREKLEELEWDETLFKQEYPSTDLEAFSLTGGSLFPAIECISTPDFIREKSPLGSGIFRKLTGHPDPFLHYVIGVDTGAGVGGDFSAAEVFCVESGEEVATFSSNKIPPPQFASMVAYLGDLFSTPEYSQNGMQGGKTPAYLVPERNQHGITIVALIRETEPYTSNKYRIFKDVSNTKSTTTGLVPLSGFVTSGTSKYRMMGILQNSISELTFHDEKTVEEIMGFSETSLGTMTNTDTEHDDRVIACALAVIGIVRERRMGVVRVVLPKIRHRQLQIAPFSVTLEDMIQSIKGKNKQDWFSDQTE